MDRVRPLSEDVEQSGEQEEGDEPDERTPDRQFVAPDEVTVAAQRQKRRRCRHAIWWDSRNDTCYSVALPISNCADRRTTASLDVYGTTSANQGGSWALPATKLTDQPSNPNYEQFDDRAVPFAGDYLWVTSLGNFAYATWTDWRNTAHGTDPRETPEDGDATTADVVQCRNTLSVTDKKGNIQKFWSSDQCPHAGGIDQNIYGDKSP